MLDKYLKDPTLIDNLDQQQKLQVYQSLQDLYQQTQTQFNQVQGQITQLQNQLQELNTQIKEFTSEDPQVYLQQLESKLTTEIKNTLTLYQEYQQKLNVN